MDTPIAIRIVRQVHTAPAKLPLAGRQFGAANWLMLGRAFGTHCEPMVVRGPETRLPTLFHTLVDATSASYGPGACGPTRRAPH